MTEEQAKRRQHALYNLDGATYAMREDVKGMRDVALTLETVTEYARASVEYKASARRVVRMLRAMADFADIELEIARGEGWT